MIELTVYFEDPFWVAVLARHEHGAVRAVRLVLGAEPTDAELYQRLMRHGTTLLADSAAAPPVPEADRGERRQNPKRLAREAARQAARPRPSTAAQEAVGRSYHAARDTADAERRADRAAADAHRYEVRRRRAADRHRGR